MKISNDIIYIGVNDRKIDLFEGQYRVPNGMAYNSYLISDEKTAIMDSVESDFYDEWIGKIKEKLNGKAPTYLVVQHMEPDHSGSIIKLVKEYPDITIVASDKAFVMMNNFFDTDFKDNRIVVKEGDSLTLGKHTLSFISAPMVHWPEVIMTYDSLDKVVFSADAFGKFGALDTEEDWACEARRYYFGIVGKYGAQVQAVLKKLASLKVNTICPLHGPVLNENLSYYIDLYNTWSSYGVESEGVLIAYASIYGNTKKAAEILKDKLLGLGCPKVVLNDLAREDMAECVEDAFRYGKAVFASVTYNGEIIPCMKSFLNELAQRNFKNKKIGFIENGSWAPMAAKTMKAMLEKCKDLTFCENEVRIISKAKESDIEKIELLAKELI